MDNSQLNREKEDREQLLARLRGKDEVLMKQLFDFYYGRLYFFAFRITGNQVEAEDIVQETFVSFWINITEKQVSPENIQAYLYGIIRNRSINYLRYKKGREKQNKEANKQFYIDLQSEMNEIILREEFYHRVSQKFSQLTPVQVRVMQLMYGEVLSVEEIAQELNTTANNVRNHKARALERLRAAFESEMLLFIIFFFIFFDLL